MQRFEHPMEVDETTTNNSTHGDIGNNFVGTSNNGNGDREVNNKSNFLGWGTAPMNIFSFPSNSSVSNSESNIKPKFNFGPLPPNQVQSSSFVPPSTPWKPLRTQPIRNPFPVEIPPFGFSQARNETCEVGVSNPSSSPQEYIPGIDYSPLGLSPPKNGICEAVFTSPPTILKKQELSSCELDQLMNRNVCSKCKGKLF